MLTTTAPALPRKWQNALSWLLQVLLAVAFGAAGSLKLIGAPEMIALFDGIGAGQWFRYVTGAVEVVIAILLLVPGLAVFGALLAVPTMLGAVATHLFLVGGSPFPAFVLLSLSAVVLWLRREQAYRLMPAR
jgi:uncharacterized membrane protein YphA (DoxX/SURF4 family)